ncbi:hypothetical protein PSTG_17463, partial [Puccinia striiformis f. sp. tritici PST-78]
WTAVCPTRTQRWAWGRLKDCWDEGRFNRTGPPPFAQPSRRWPHPCPNNNARLDRWLDHQSVAPLPEASPTLEASKISVSTCSPQPCPNGEQLVGGLLTGTLPNVAASVGPTVRVDFSPLQHDPVISDQ